MYHVESLAPYNDMHILCIYMLIMRVVKSCGICRATQYCSDGLIVAGLVLIPIGGYCSSLGI